MPKSGAHSSSACCSRRWPCLPPGHQPSASHVITADATLRRLVRAASTGASVATESPGIGLNAALVAGRVRASAAGATARAVPARRPAVPERRSARQAARGCRRSDSRRVWATSCGHRPVRRAVGNQCPARFAAADDRSAVRRGQPVGSRPRRRPCRREPAARDGVLASVSTSTRPRTWNGSRCSGCWSSRQPASAALEHLTTVSRAQVA